MLPERTHSNGFFSSTHIDEEFVNYKLSKVLHDILLTITSTDKIQLWRHI